MAATSLLKTGGILLTLLLVGGIVSAIVANQTVVVVDVDVTAGGLNLDEEAYYEYVAPRIDALVLEVDATRDMVESKSRDILALSRAGTVIETLTTEIRDYGDTHGVPPRFADVHERILSASITVTDTFDAAKSALRTFDFSGMNDLVTGFGHAADEFAACQQELRSILDDAATGRNESEHDNGIT